VPGERLTVRLPPDVELPPAPVLRHLKRADRVCASAVLGGALMFAAGGVGFAFAAHPLAGIAAGGVLLAVVGAFVWWVET
jgi:hypothetical protein